MKCSVVYAAFFIPDGFHRPPKASRRRCGTPFALLRVLSLASVRFALANHSAWLPHIVRIVRAYMSHCSHTCSASFTHMLRIVLRPVRHVPATVRIVPGHVTHRSRNCSDRSPHHDTPQFDRLIASPPSAH